MPKPQVQGPLVPGQTVNPRSLGLHEQTSRDQELGTQDSFPVLRPSMMLWNPVSELVGLEQLAQPLITELG